MKFKISNERTHDFGSAPDLTGCEALYFRDAIQNDRDVKLYIRNYGERMGCYELIYQNHKIVEIT
jgi:hypothetical protein